MPYTHALIDLDRIPSSEARETLIHIAERHNALVKGATDNHKAIKADLDAISGATDKEKTEMHGFFALMRTVVAWLHGHRGNGFMAVLTFYLISSLAKQWGLTPEHVAQFLQLLNGGN